DGAELPGDGAILVPAARFLEDPEAILKHAGKVGVIWPNNRDLDDLVPYLDRLSATAALTARRACCASGTAMTGSCAPPARCCATSSYSCRARALTRSR